jgi:hypothetical protein
MKLSFIFAAMTLSGCATLQERCEESWRDVVERTKARTSVDCSITHEDFSEHIWSLKRQYETKICPGVLPASYDDELVSWYTQKNDLKQRIAVRVQDSDRDIQFSLPYVSLIIAHTEDRGVVFEGEVESLATGVLDKEKALIVDLNDSVRFYTLRVNGQGNRQGVAFTNLYYIGQRDVFTERFGVLEMPVYSPNKSSIDADEEEEIRVEIARLQEDLQAVQAKIDDRHKLRDQQTEEASKCQSEKHGLWREGERLDRLQYKYNTCKERRESLPQCRAILGG